MNGRKTLLTALLGMAAIASTYEPRHKGIEKCYTPGNTLEDNGKPIRQQNRPLIEFKIKGQTVMAYSRKDAIKRLKHKNSK